MLLNRLVSIARCQTNINQLTGFFQKCKISSTPTALSKLEISKPLQVVNLNNENLDPVKNINDKIKSDEVGRLFAVIQLLGKQFKVTAGDVILVEGLWEPTNGDKLRLDKVLLAGSKDFSLIGRPILPIGLIDVQATIIEKSLSHTRTVFKKKRRKQYMRINFARMETTQIRINSIEITNLVDKDKTINDNREIY
ncbi:CLUMA_CG013628, isoform A [Clunio marinus]|uniref:Large ribosomal subunit protein bL21m n=1 Tax=Clunio marinus TaxID=568069 RepID=A0A1J1ILC0_9DIPT|nr:CLUMA_CG013628, isoform A [Clunio marinus]